MIFDKQRYDEKGFNYDIVNEDFSIVIASHHVGVSFNCDNITFTLQTPKTTWFFTFGNEKYRKRMDL